MKQLEWFVTGIVILALAIVGLLYALSGPSPEAIAAAEQRNRVAEGIRLTVEQRAGIVFTNFVPGVKVGEKLWDFRGEASGTGRVEPVYGIARLVCERMQPIPRCWQIVRLERDGRTLIDGDDQGPAASDTNVVNEPVIRQTPAPVTSAPSAPAPAAAAAPLPAAIAEWQVTGSTVNGRAGPGTTFPVVVRLTPENRMRLIELDGRWGHYEIVSPAADAGQRMWVWSDLVTEIK
ncbi:MAG: hypothetical protein P1U65_11770 [Minwuia sp.]|nr:hypothetical protein [Minwuia sp.]